MPKINPIWLQKPTGEGEAAFSSAKAIIPPPNRADQALQEFRRDIIDTPDQRYVDPGIQGLVKSSTTAKVVAAMPPKIKFEDVDTTAAAARPVAPPNADRIEPSVICIAEAASGQQNGRPVPTFSRRSAG